MAERLSFREAIDLPEKGAIAVGLGLFALSPLVPAALPVASELIVGGGFGLGMSRAMLPRKD